MKKVLLSLTLVSALLISSCGSAAGVGALASGASGSTGGTSSSSAWGAGGSCTIKPGTANAICTDYASIDANSIQTGCASTASTTGAGSYSSSGCSTTGMIGKCVNSYSATYYGSAYSSYGSSLCNDTWTSLNGGSTGSTGSTGSATSTTKYGAVAVGTSLGYGVATDASSQSSADSTAKTNCSAQTTNCTVQLQFTTCGALATGSNGKGGAASESDKKFASDLALAQCWTAGGTSCTVAWSGCNTQ